MNPLAIATLAAKALDLIGEAVTDTDKRNELNAKIVELQTQATIAIVQTPTVPWVDGVVKLLYALVALAAPIGTALMTAWALWAYTQGVDLPAEVHGALAASFPLWRAARHREKMHGTATPTMPAARSGPPR